MLSKKEQKYIQSLKVKKYRTREKRFLVEGAKNVLELLSSDFEIDLIVSTKEFLNELSDESSNLRIETVSENLLSQLGAFKTNETCLALARQKQEKKFSLELTDHLFVLDGVGDPGNFGTIIRTLDWFGFHHLVCSSDCAEFYHPKTIASTMGSFTRVTVYYEELNQLLKDVKEPVLGADGNGSNMYSSEIKSPSIIIMGSESHGIRPELFEILTKKIAIPKVGMAESLNVGVATGIIAGYLRHS